MKTLLTSAALIATLTVGAIAAGGEGHTHDGETAHDMRGKIMESFGKNLKTLGAMASGDADFDAAQAETLLMEVNAGAIRFRDEFDTLWPEDSVNDPNTEAAPAIWEMPDEFAAAIDQFITDTTLETYPTDGFELGPVLGAIGKNCKTCHEDFRIKKN